MFAGFNLKVGEEISSYKEFGDQIYIAKKKQVEQELESFINSDGSIEGTKMQSNWFPQIEADIFISHSHNDEEKAICLAGWLKATFNLDAFIDSYVWGSADALLKKIDNKYCKNQGDSTYNYDKRNYSTSHVHTMLTTALAKMIDNTECIMFLNTPETICTSDIINQTKSPWIYLEIAMSQLVRRTEPNRSLGIVKKAMFEASEQLTINYNIDMQHLKDINLRHLEEWKEIHQENNLKFLLSGYDKIHPLDSLYTEHGFIKGTVKA
ncbi:toll/interleukin-1 receptor domain-containing protein [Priestia megaterium]|uniref:toll/interleukin-1 receptor domain-containing protein n=1 Tax=Priestia megaterium TaxID=1404 RepID=UPI00207A7F09|nr:toll/interleukin-1 receptor domain-containing protein [Priestia megaterium]USL39605.1 toll/interleukin-1 receptor domain-containing protein [Priestia megaterium]